MSQKLTPRQQEQLQFLQNAAPKIQRVQALIEQMASNQTDEAGVRQLVRLLDEIKAGGSQLKIPALPDAAGQMAMLARRGGGQQAKARALRELLAALKQNYDVAMRKALKPEEGGAA